MYKDVVNPKIHNCGCVFCLKSRVLSSVIFYMECGLSISSRSSFVSPPSVRDDVRQKYVYIMLTWLSILINEDNMVWCKCLSWSGTWWVTGVNLLVVHLHRSRDLWRRGKSPSKRGRTCQHLAWSYRQRHSQLKRLVLVILLICGIFWPSINCVLHSHVSSVMYVVLSSVVYSCFLEHH
jgi:hypothetical protein